MPKTTLRDIPPAEQVQMFAALRRARYGYLILHSGEKIPQAASALFYLEPYEICS